MSTPSPPNRLDIQLMMWDDCKFLIQLQKDFIEGRKQPSKRWSMIAYLIQTKAGLGDKLLSSLKDAELEDLRQSIEQIKLELHRK